MDAEQVQAVVVSSEPAAEPSPAGQPVVTMRLKRRLSKPLLFVGVGVAAVLLIGGGYVFGFYLPNLPQNVFSASMSNTAAAIDHLLDYSKQQNAVNYKSMAYDGTLTVKSPSASFDATLSGNADQKGNSSSTLSGDVMGQKMTVNLRTIHVHDDASPDMYFQVNGVKQVLAMSGLSDGLDSIGALDGQWLSIDHTLIDTYAAQLKSSDNTQSAQDALVMPTYAQVDDAARKVQAVNKRYLFTTDSTHAILTQQKFIGQEVADGHTLNHYTVGYNKMHFESYVEALKGALDGSSLNEWSKKANGGKSLSTTLDLDSMKSDIAKSKGTYTFDLWADTKTKLVSKVAFKNPDDASSVFALSQGYTGGSNYPFSMTFNGKDDTGNDQNAVINFGLDTASHKITANMAMTSKASDGTTQLNLSLHAQPSNDTVTISAPAGATSINNLLNELGLGGGSLPLNTSATPLVFQQ